MVAKRGSVCNLRPMQVVAKIKRQARQPLTIRLAPALREAAEKAAADDHRSLSSLVAIALAEHLKQKHSEFSK